MKSKWESEKENLNKLINEDKISYEEIGRRYGCSGNNIKKVARKLGINLPQRRAVSIKVDSVSEKCKEEKVNKCIICGKPISERSKFCGNTCHAKYDRDKYIERWKLGQETGLSGQDCIITAVRMYLREKYNNSCQICGWNTINTFTGNVPLQIHHIDGNCKNNSEENLQLLCPNCHSLTENFGSRNKNCTRVDKRVR